MSIGDLGLWQLFALLQHELLLFAGIFFLIGAADDLVVDGIWLWLRFSGKAVTGQRPRDALRQRPLHAPAAVLIPAWQEAAVIGDTIAHLLASWPQRDLRVYVGCYRNDPATLAAAVAAAAGDGRLRLVIHDRDGPSTKADCLNRLYTALATDEARSGRRFAMMVFHDAEDMVDPAALALLDEGIAGGADFVQLPVEPLVQRHGTWLANHLGSHYCEEFADAQRSASEPIKLLAAGGSAFDDLAPKPAVRLTASFQNFRWNAL
ncbi:glycosyltransferase [Erythrobacter sp.]|uniref:glycosyltransferase n=1 Tax=Erythrobacter sp. TaxID=1042 RepID=UPI0025D78FAA|nr:glycosyltransferase [Erythrobacter sp.]